MKKMAFKITVIVLVLLVALVVAVFLSLNSIVKKGLETVAPKITKVAVELEGVQVSPFFGFGRITGLVIGNPEGVKTEAAIKMGHVHVSLNPASVLSRTILVRQIEGQAP